MTVKVAQESHPRGKDRWDWSIWIDATAKELDGIASVTYTLHPTFPDPVRQVTTRRNKFRLDSSGWGEFEIFIAIQRKDGKSLRRRHWLTLADEADSAAPRKAVEGAKEAKAEDPVAFISSGSADAAIARKLADALASKGIRAVLPEDLGAGIPLDKAVDRLMGKADIAIFLLSSRPSLWMRAEMERAIAHKVRHIIPVVIGTNVEWPPQLESIQALQVNSARELPAIVDQVLAKSGMNR